MPFGTAAEPVPRALCPCPFTIEFEYADDSGHYSAGCKRVFCPLSVEETFQVPGVSFVVVYKQDQERLTLRFDKSDIV